MRKLLRPPEIFREGIILYHSPERNENAKPDSLLLL